LAYPTKDIGPFFSLAAKCHSSIHEIAVAVQGNPRLVNTQQAGRMQRCLIVFGSLCEHSRKCSDLLYDSYSSSNDSSCRSISTGTPTATSASVATATTITTTTATTIATVLANATANAASAAVNTQRIFEEEERMARLSVVRLSAVLPAIGLRGACYSACLFATKVHHARNHTKTILIPY